MPRLLPLIAATCAAVLLAAGCTKDDPEPNYSSVTPTASATTTTPTTPPTSTSPTGVPTTGPNVNPGEVAPTEPASVRSNTSDGALAFIAYYVKTTDWLFATSDTSIITPFFAESCVTCFDAQEYLTNLVSGESHFKGGRIVIRSIQVVKNDGRRGADFAITSLTDVGAAQVLSSDGDVIRRFPASAGFQLTDWVRFVDGSWRIVEERKV